MSAADHVRALKRRSNERPTLEHALLFGGLGRYLAHRLRYFVLSEILLTLVHLAESLLVFRSFAGGALVPALVVQNATVALAHAWWGVLELLRQEIVTVPRGPARDVLLGRWLARAASVVLLALTAGTTYMIWDRTRQGVTSIFAIYGAACFLRLAFDAFNGTLLAATAPLRRVYRPVAAALGVELGGLAVALLMAPSMGVFALPISFASAVVASRLVTLVYASRAFRMVHGRAPRLPWNDLRAPRRTWEGLRLREVAAAAAAGVSLKGATWIVLAIASLPATETTQALSLVAHVLRPFLASGGGWMGTVATDLQRLQEAPWRRAFARFARSLAWASVALGVLATLLATAALRLLVPELGPLTHATAAAWLLARHRLAVAQMLDLAAMRFLRPVMSTALVLGVVLALGLEGGVGAEALGLDGCLVALALATVAAGAFRARAAARARAPRNLTAASWLHEVRSRCGPIRIARLELLARPSTTVVDALRRRSAGEQALVVRAGSGLLLAEPREVPLGLSRLVELSGGSLVGCKTVEGPTGSLAIERARELGLLPARRSEDLDVMELERIFRQAFPEGRCFVVDGSRRAAAPPFDAARGLAAVKAALGCGKRRRGDPSVVALAPDGDLRAAFVVDSPEPAAWERFRALALGEAAPRQKCASGASSFRPGRRSRHTSVGSAARLERLHP